MTSSLLSLAQHLMGVTFFNNNGQTLCKTFSVFKVVIPTSLILNILTCQSSYNKCGCFENFV